MLKGLIIRTPQIDYILSGAKTWEMRSTGTAVRGKIGLIRKGSGLVAGTVDLVGCMGPLTDEQMKANQHCHLISPDRLSEPQIAKWRYAWILESAAPLRQPVPYRHPRGAVIWVTLDGVTEDRIVFAAQ